MIKPVKRAKLLEYNIKFLNQTVSRLSLLMLEKAESAPETPDQSEEQVKTRARKKASEPDTSKPETSKPETTKAETSKPVRTKSESPKPEPFMPVQPLIRYADETRGLQVPADLTYSLF